MYLRPQKHCAGWHSSLFRCARHRRTNQNPMRVHFPSRTSARCPKKPSVSPPSKHTSGHPAHTHAVHQRSIAGTLVALRAENLKCVFAATSNPPSHKHARSCFLRWGLVCTALQRRWTGWRGGRAHERKSALTKCFRSRVGCAHTQSCALHSP